MVVFKFIKTKEPNSWNFRHTFYRNINSDKKYGYIFCAFVLIKCMTEISVVGLFCLDKFENNQRRTCTTFFRTSKLNEVYFSLKLRLEASYFRTENHSSLKGGGVIHKPCGQFFRYFWPLSWSLLLNKAYVTKRLFWLTPLNCPHGLCMAQAVSSIDGIAWSRYHLTVVQINSQSVLCMGQFLMYIKK